MFFNDFWNRVDTLRQGTLTVLCESTGLNTGTIMVTRSKNKLPNLADAFKIAQYLNCTIDYLLTGEKGYSLNATERELIDNYRCCLPATRFMVELACKQGRTQAEDEQRKKENCLG